MFERPPWIIYADDPAKFRFPYSFSMGRIPQPTAILDAKGAFLTHPERRRPNEPYETRPLGSPPKYLSDEAKKLWKEIAHNLLPGVSKVSDRHAFETSAPFVLGYCPTPVSDALCGLPPPLSASRRIALGVPVAAGLNP